MWQEMSSVGEGEEEIFFDTKDYLVSGKEDMVYHSNNTDYDIWVREPQSVRERRENFLSRMGFVEPLTYESSGAVDHDAIMESSNATIDEDLLSERRKSNSEANCSVDYSDHDWLDDISMDLEGESNDNPRKCQIVHQACVPTIHKRENKKMMRWWRHFTQKMKNKNQGCNVSTSKLCGEAVNTTRVKMEQNRKRFMECTGVYTGQQLKAHNGLIWTMKFSPGGQYLATGGEDGVVCIWCVTTVDALDKSSYDKSSPQKKKSFHASVVIPEKIFYIEEEPLRKFQGHGSDVLDLAWSTSNHLLSSSMDKTVRLWQTSSDECLGVFCHINYVTCVQFNPVDENYFISGSIDGKVRIWEITRNRVEDWVNAQDIVTALCYQPNGRGFVVGSVSGTCRFYELSGNEFLLSAEININGRKKSSGYRITGIQFLKNDSQRVMITSEDSKIRILDGFEVVCKYTGPTKSGGQMSASLTPSGRHIVSVSEDSHVYLWNYNDFCIQTSKPPKKSTSSFESFFSQGVSVALPWSNPDMVAQNHSVTCGGSLPYYGTEQQCFSLANWFSLDGSSSVTWPEEKLPLWDLPILSEIWGLVFVTGNRDGTIRTFQNYGLPVRT